MEKKHNPCRKNSMSTLNVHVAKHYYMYTLLQQAVTEYMHVHVQSRIQCIYIHWSNSKQRLVIEEYDAHIQWKPLRTDNLHT